jgi:hypothetical protein
LIRETRARKFPLWAKIIFETPELLNELLCKGGFPRIRKGVIDISTKVINWCESRMEMFPNTMEYIQERTIQILEWINNHWNK